MSAKVYFFKGNQYVQCDAATKAIDPGYPRSIADDWNGLKQIGFDSNLNAAEYFNNNLYFFKGSNYAVYNLEGDALIAHGPISDYFHNIPPGFGDSPDAVCLSFLTPNLLIFFKGAYYIYCDISARNAWAGPALIAGNVPVATRYDSDMQASLAIVGVANYYFKDGYVGTYGTALDVPVSSVWLGLSNHGFDQGIQAVVYLATEKKQSQTPPPPTPGSCGGTCGDTSSGKQCFTIPPNTEFGFTAFVNSHYKDVIHLFIDDQLVDTLTGSGLKNVYLGTKIYNSGKGKVCVSVEANGKPCKLRFVDNPLSGKPGFAVVAAEDSTDNDYNDSFVLLNWPLT